ncbi:hypothetical protein P43SY_003029 [Pythium insidiosum]|uniref:MRH domain-containing protein n=1 Tax=Pythium insidiosum TaxID=114742 RepID=A0AAD5QC22_PYTIN|nr:hypothetical protein P43SY_003029 [Pythium insidiosum]
MKTMAWSCALLLSLAAACGLSHATGDGISSTGPAYVVQIHASRDAFKPPPPDEMGLPTIRAHFMTTESGRRLECFLPLTPQLKDERKMQQLKARGLLGSDVSEEDKNKHQFLEQARAAATKIRPHCLQYVDRVENWVYEICPKLLMRKIRMHSSGSDLPAADRGEEGRSSIHEVSDLASYARDDAQSPLPFDEFIHNDLPQRLSRTAKPLYTQQYQRRDKDQGGHDFTVQFICSTTVREDMIAAVQWKDTSSIDSAPRAKEPRGFLVASRMFCQSKPSAAEDADETFTVGSLLKPLADMKTCIKRNEGWWTYEFCIGHGARQYHREADGRITAEFSLGDYDDAKNREIEATGEALVSDHIDATHDMARPAFMELYTGGTHCKEFDVSKPRQSKVLYYCSQGGANHHILSVKETQTCAYTIKISSPIVCEHPHFINEEPRGAERPDVVHCVPAESQENDASLMQSGDSHARAAIANRIQEVVVPAV